MVARLLGSVALLSLILLLALRAWLGDFLDHGERCPILARLDRFEPLEDGTVRLESVARAGGAISLPSPTPHIIHWTRLADRVLDRELIVCNTHLGFISRERGSVRRALVELLREVPKATPVFLAGDFNDTPGSALVRDLISSQDANLRFHDAWTEARGRSAIARTIVWGKQPSGPRIDYIMTRPRMEVASAEVLASHADAGPASDHHPLLVLLSMGED